MAELVEGSVREGLHPERIRRLNDAGPDPRGRYVLYWMQSSQRARESPALEHAIRLANARGESVLALFGLTERYPEASERHYAFLLEGLADAAEALAARGVKLLVLRDSPDAAALRLAGEASVVVTDRGYLRLARRWRARVAREAGRAVVEVEGDVVVPAEEASTRREWAARTLRPKIARLRDRFLVPLREARPQKSSVPLRATGDLDPRRPAEALAPLRIDRSVPPAPGLRGGTREARRRLRAFLRDGLPGYAEGRGDPNARHASGLSPYLHLGQISPVEVARAARGCARASSADREAFLEELVVRRELAVNYVLFERRYDAFEALPEWARRTLRSHAEDPRPHRYGARRLEAARTHDRVWNAAMREMRATGTLHNHVRMYWGKKILEWSSSPERAFRTALRLNNRYLLDGRDPSSYANVAWLFGLHDRPWGERPVYGTVRSMSAKGLARKFDVETWAAEAEARAEAAEAGRR